MEFLPGIAYISRQVIPATGFFLRRLYVQPISRTRFKLCRRGGFVHVFYGRKVNCNDENTQNKKSGSHNSERGSLLERDFVSGIWPWACPSVFMRPQNAIPIHETACVHPSLALTPPWCRWRLFFAARASAILIKFNDAVVEIYTCSDAGRAWRTFSLCSILDVAKLAALSAADCRGLFSQTCSRHKFLGPGSLSRPGCVRARNYAAPSALLTASPGCV